MGIIETERLILRPFTHDDAPRVLDIQSRLDVIRWLSDPPFIPMPDLDEARAWIDNWNTGDIGPLNCGYAIEVRDTGVLAGTAMIVQVPYPINDERQVGWHLHPDSSGHGYATEAAVAVIDQAFVAGLDEIWCGMYPDNEASARVARRLGLVERGLVPDPWYLGYSRYFTATRDEWAKR
ncbi:RimJ/RimL family protein N-acetyltransferase [Aeromicrobium panaciterrae]|uniref:RimJ/RimL family protein N-acetyltransferase n=1 Tax=Aeromicrobium panaciterrae TaxID=363861 RepID=A0ABU1ULW5_9ACTN|nr:GNAT family N-acetyltransferase [Aeromicrobium panaciterrae]MDR7086168.1 RimJ/RimL family protein N-acetyltransferase [Aeromicrobium panaciterrae]